MFSLRNLTRRASGMVKRSLPIKRKTCAATFMVINRRAHETTEKEKDELEDEEYDELSSRFLGIAPGGHGALVLQPYIKWGANKKRNTTPELQLEEAVTLLKTLQNWRVVDKMCVSLMNLKKKELLGKGNLESLKIKVRSNPEITAVFIGTNLLQQVQIQELRHILGVPVYDRYSIVVQIFRAHAKSQEAKLQVAIAEIPYMWMKLNVVKETREEHVGTFESHRKLLQVRETKLKNALLKLKAQRHLLRSKRLQNKIPTIAVVGYTNAGKTSLIKALTGDSSLHPRNYLFATLDVTIHQGILPSRLKVLFVDTIGFIQDVPATLIEPFVATLEDAMNADIILNVHDASHPDRQAQMDHMQATLKGLIKDQVVINVANKIDRISEDIPRLNMLGVSATKLIGIDGLRDELDKSILGATGRTIVRIRVQSGSRASAWLYKETTVTNVEADPENAQYLFMDVITTELQLKMFRVFLKKYE
ncbi:putative GTP-binding protein 6 [Neodiprion pinetum]|uniref:putative GTP-binding protein 6 n=1 Tax=Neodiprion pinetum TaxID=441929 RepID=UPI001EE0FF9D|nr:putative GTP-binding protein 6 [Neodiprion pinetum]